MGTWVSLGLIFIDRQFPWIQLGTDQWRSGVDGKKRLCGHLSSGSRQAGPHDLEKRMKAPGFPWSAFGILCLFDVLQARLSPCPGPGHRSGSLTASPYLLFCCHCFRCLARGRGVSRSLQRRGPACEEGAGQCRISSSHGCGSIWKGRLAAQAIAEWRDPCWGARIHRGGCLSGVVCGVRAEPGAGGREGLSAEGGAGLSASLGLSPGEGRSEGCGAASCLPCFLRGLRSAGLMRAGTRGLVCEAGVV